MLSQDFDALPNFTMQEVLATNAKIQDVQFDTLRRLQLFRSKLSFYYNQSVTVHLVKNGLTTGTHSRHSHPQGKAVDCYLGIGFNRDWAHVYQGFKTALEVGYKEIGLYWNGNIYQFHLGINEQYHFWTGYKAPRQKTWRYSGLIINPATLGG